MQSEFEERLNEMNIDSKVKIKNHIHEFENLQEATEKRHRQEIQRLLKDTDEKEETFLKQIDEREEKIRVLEDTSTSRLDDKAFLKTILNMDQPKMTLEDKLVKTNVNSSGHGQNRPSGPTPPKMGTFTGKEEWRHYFLKFCHITNKYEWSDQDRLDKLIECLRDRALNLFTTRPKFVQNNYKLICKKMEERFGCKDLPQVIRRQLQELRQFPEEQLEEYAERAQYLAVDGFPGTSDDFLQIVATDAFLKGCHDKRAALTAMDKDPENLDRAVQFVKSAMTNQRVILGIKKTDVKRVTFQEIAILMMTIKHPHV